MEIKRPIVKLLHHTPLEIAELAARSCYGSFDKADVYRIRAFTYDKDIRFKEGFQSPLVEKIVNGYHHESIAEHIYCNFFIDNISRGVLQELARHRVASLSVRSTRYTMGKIISAIIFYKFIESNMNYRKLIDIFQKERVFVISDSDLFYKVELINRFIDDVLKIIDDKYEYYLSKSQIEYLEANDYYNIDEFLELKIKKNIGDDFKLLVSDAWRTELIWTINLRSLKNFLKLRDSGSAYKPIRELAKEINLATPIELLSVIGIEKIGDTLA